MLFTLLLDPLRQANFRIEVQHICSDAPNRRPSQDQDSAPFEVIVPVFSARIEKRHE